MRRHVVCPLIIVDKPWVSFWNQFIYKGLEVFSNCWVGIFIDAKPGRSMLDKDVQRPYPNLPDFWKTILNLIRD